MKLAIEGYAVDRQTAAEDVLGITENQFRIWSPSLYPELHKGQGFHIAYSLRQLPNFGAVAQLVEHGFSVTDACAAISPNSVYHRYLDYPKDPAAGAELVLSRIGHRNRWVAASGDDIEFSITIRTRPLIKRIAKKLLNVARRDARLADLDRVRIERSFRELMALGGMTE